MHIVILNGPNLNLVGQREPALYGSAGFDEYLPRLRALFAADEIEYFQSNVEGVLIDALHAAAARGADGVILNAGGYSHTSVALADAVRAVSIPVIEVHLTNILAREEYRHVSLTGAACRGVISGFGMDGYRLAREAIRAIVGEE